MTLPVSVSFGFVFPAAATGYPSVQYSRYLSNE